MRGFAAIGLYHPKNHLNVGSVIRAARCFDAAMVACSGYRITRRRCPTDPGVGVRHLPCIYCDDLMDVAPAFATIVGVEIANGARDLASYTHPESAYYIFGPEDGSLPPSALALCRDVVQIPSRYCLNLAAAVNVVLYDRSAKRGDQWTTS